MPASPMYYPLARPLVRERRPLWQKGCRAFTLIELLTVIAIIGILVAITLNVATGVKSRAAMGQAKAELSAAAQALESYKRQYGDYPQTNQANAMLNAIIGKRGPLSSATLNGITGKNFLELSKFTVSDSTALGSTQVDPFTVTTAVLVDPWGTPYVYIYKQTGAASWTSSYILYSLGPPNSLNNQTPSTGAPAPYDATTGLLRITDATGALIPAYASYIFANR